ncbi:MAG TPA: helix-turn-helix domain-containing protein, partial [Arachidicoccus sp.]
VNPQNLIIIQPHAYLSIDDIATMEGRVLCFDEILFSRTAQLRRYLWRMLTESVKCPVVSLAQPGIIYEYIKFQLDMFDKQFVQEEKSVIKDHLLHNILSNIFILVNVSLDETPALIHFTIRKKRLLHFLELLEIHFATEHQLEFYAGKMNFSTQRLNLICNESLGINAKKLLQEKILREAKRLLLFETKSPPEVASLLKFKDLRDFKHFFDTQSNSSCEAFLWQHQLP